MASIQINNQSETACLCSTSVERYKDSCLLRTKSTTLVSLQDGPRIDYIASNVGTFPKICEGERDESTVWNSFQNAGQKYRGENVRVGSFDPLPPNSMLKREERGHIIKDWSIAMLWLVPSILTKIVASFSCFHLKRIQKVIFSNLSSLLSPSWWPWTCTVHIALQVVLFRGSEDVSLLKPIAQGCQA